MKRWKKIFAAAVIATAVTTGALAAEKNNEPSELNADAVDYNTKTGIVKARGNVLLKHGTGRATGKRAMYNTKTQEAYLIGDVIVVRDDLRMTCDKLRSDGQGHMQADGNVHGTQTVKPDEKYPNGDTRTFTGDHVDYYPNDKKHIVVPDGGVVTSGDGTFTADHMEGWLDENYYIGTGNVHAVSPPRNMEAGGDKVEYFGNDGGKAVLTGNAWAYQDNNTVKGNRITVFMSENQKLIAVPDETDEEVDEEIKTADGK